jgi:hypothetical protein
MWTVTRLQIISGEKNVMQERSAAIFSANISVWPWIGDAGGMQRLLVQRRGGHGGDLTAKAAAMLFST